MKNAILFIAVFLISSVSAQISPSGCYISGALVNQGPNGCGNAGNYCNLASVFVPAFSPTTCGTSTSSGSSAMNLSTSLILPAGCTANIVMEFKPRNYYGAPVVQNGNGCSNSGMDGGDGMSITNSGGTIASQGATVLTSNTPTCSSFPALGTYTFAASSITTGCSNSSGTVAMVVSGGTCVLNGISNRGDEIVTFTINLSGSCGVNCDLVLPVEVIDFSGTAQPEGIYLNWTGLNERNIDSYLIEKSADAVNYSPLGSVKSEGAGRNRVYYQYLDDAPYPAYNYYRLSSVENSKMKQQQNILVFNSNSKELFYAVTEHDCINIFYASSLRNKTFEIIDLAGRTVKKIQSSEAGNIKIPSSDLASGLYFLTCAELPQAGNCKIILY